MCRTENRPNRGIIPFCLALLAACGMAHGGEADSAEAALRFAPDDPRLEWGPCPEFFGPECRIAVLHGDPAAPDADLFFRLPADTPIPRHSHTSAERMVLVSGELHVTYDGQDTVVLKPGDYAYGPPGLPHDGRCAQGDPCVLFIAFVDPVDAVALDEAAD